MQSLSLCIIDVINLKDLDMNTFRDIRLNCRLYAIVKDIIIY